MDKKNLKRVLILVNRDFVLYNFRIELVECLLKDEYEVYMCLPYGPKVDDMVRDGCKYIPIDIDKRGTNPFRDILLINAYRNIFSSIKPDIILMYTTKVCIYAGIVAGFLNIPYLVNISGLGTALESKGILRPLMIRLYRRAVKYADCVFFQNKENEAFFEYNHIYKGNKKLIPGSGVNLSKWRYLEYPSGENNIEFLFIARVIKEKGIEEYLYAADVIKKEYSNTVFHVLGPCDGNYREILEEEEQKDIIKYHGEVWDTAEYLLKAHCIIHPSYYPEGVSNILLESAASGRPVITTNRSGCRETVEDGITGYIFEIKNREQLINCIRKFMKMPNFEREKMGIAGRRKMEREFDRNIVIDEYMKMIKKR